MKAEGTENRVSVVAPVLCTRGIFRAREAHPFPSLFRAGRTLRGRADSRGIRECISAVSASRLLPRGRRAFRARINGFLLKQTCITRTAQRLPRAHIMNYRGADCRVPFFPRRLSATSK